jgi:hypothetical protein
MVPIVQRLLSLLRDVYSVWFGLYLCFINSHRPCILNQLFWKLVSFLFHGYCTWHLWTCQTVSHVTSFHPSCPTSQLNPLMSLSNNFWMYYLFPVKVISRAGRLKYVLFNSLIHWVPGALSVGIKRPGSEADISLPFSAKIKNAWSCISTPQHTFMAWCSVKSTGTTLLLPHLAYFRIERFYVKEKHFLTLSSSHPLCFCLYILCLSWRF